MTFGLVLPVMTLASPRTITQGRFQGRGEGAAHRLFLPDRHSKPAPVSWSSWKSSALHTLPAEVDVGIGGDAILQPDAKAMLSTKVASGSRWNVIAVQQHARV